MRNPNEPCYLYLVQFHDGRPAETATSIRAAKRLAGGYADEIDDLEGRRWLVFRSLSGLRSGFGECATIQRLTPLQRRAVNP
jgi:hypothetical protein